MKLRNTVVTAVTAGLLLAAMAAPAAAPKIRVHALFESKALFTIDGSRRLLKVGESSPEGVKLIATDTLSERMTIERNGRRETLALGIVAMPRAPELPEPTLSASVVLQANGKHFFADGAINGERTRFLVDTGATAVTISGDEAKRLGIDYTKGSKVVTASTANGDVQTYLMKLERVQVGAIELKDIETSVVEGKFPKEPLLGMSFLGQLDVRSDGSRMELSKR